MVVLTIDQGDVDRRAAQRFGGLDAPEARADDHDVGSLPRHALSSV
jgi:hypothetical protein